MPHPESTGLLQVAESVHWAALGVMGIVYTVRLLWVFRFKAGKDHSAPGGNGRTDPKSAAIHSLFNVAMPWQMESTRTNVGFWVSFVLFHLGVAAGIGLAFTSGIAPPSSPPHRRLRHHGPHGSRLRRRRPSRGTPADRALCPPDQHA